MWSLGNVFAARAGRQLGPIVTLAWVMLVGLVLLGVGLLFGPGVRWSGRTVAWLAVGGVGNAVGLLLLYRALRTGSMGVVMPLVSTEGGLAALIAVVGGQSIGLVTAAAMAIVVLGVVLTTPRRAGVHGGAADDRRAAVIAAVAALCMSGSMYATGRAGSLVPLAWAVVPPRLVGVALVTLPLVLSGRLRRPSGRVALWLVVAGVCEVGGFLLFAWGARGGNIAVAAVLSSLTGAMGVGWGRLAFAERLRPLQLLGVLVIFAGVATVSATTA